MRGLLGWMMGGSSHDQEGDEATRLRRALEFCIPIVRRFSKDREVYIARLDEDASASYELIEPIFQKIGYSPSEPQLVGYKFADVDVREYIRIYKTSETAAEVLRNALGMNDVHGMHVSDGARSLRSLILWQAVTPPPRPPRAASTLHRDTLLSGLAFKVRDRFGFKMGAAKATYQKRKKPPINACTIAAASFLPFGIRVDAPRADDIARKNIYLSIS